jgi:hypothetical protein
VCGTYVHRARGASLDAELDCVFHTSFSCMHACCQRCLRPHVLQVCVCAPAVAHRRAVAHRVSRRLQAMTPDQNRHLEWVPDNTSAQEISCFLFGGGHPDWAMYASMFTCLVHPLEGKLSLEEVGAEAPCSPLLTRWSSCRFCLCGACGVHIVLASVALHHSLRSHAPARRPSPLPPRRTGGRTESQDTRSPFCVICARGCHHGRTNVSQKRRAFEHALPRCAQCGLQCTPSLARQVSAVVPVPQFASSIVARHRNP